MRLYGGVEMGGTKCICAVGSNPNTLDNVVTISTKNPNETLQHIIDYFKAVMKVSPLEAIGVDLLVLWICTAN